MTDKQKLQNIKNRVIAVNSQKVLGVMTLIEYENALACLSEEISELEQKYEKKGLFKWL